MMDQKEEQKEHFFLLLSNSSEVSIVDKDDYYRFRGFNWKLKDDGYVITDSSISAKRRGIAAKLRLHRLILGIEDGPDVDHINGNKLDNRKCNLRRCTRSENLRNRIKSKDVRGVYLRTGKKYSHWFSVIQLPNSKPKKQKYLGSFKTRKEAAQAFIKASLELHGEFSPYKGVQLDDES